MLTRLRTNGVFNRQCAYMWGWPEGWPDLSKPPGNFYFPGYGVCLHGFDGENTCNGDSGGPVEWSDVYDKYRSYLIAIHASVGDKECGEMWRTRPSMHSLIIDSYKWFIDKGGEDVKECLRPLGWNE